MDRMGYGRSLRSRKIKAWMAENHRIIEQLLRDPNFEVRPDGTIWTLWSDDRHPVVTFAWRRAEIIDTQGYLRIWYRYGEGTRDNRKRRLLRAHRIVAAKKFGELEPGLVINHKDGDKKNNHPDNLEEITFEENTQHAFAALGQSPIKNFRLSLEIAREIRALKEQGWLHSEIALKFDISKGHVSEIVNNKIWIDPYLPPVSEAA